MCAPKPPCYRSRDGGCVLPRLGILVAGALLASTVLLCADGWVGARAESPTPVRTTVPVGSSRITATYTFKGTPFIHVTGPITFARVDGEGCDTGGPDVVYTAITDSIPWPWRDRSPCNELGAHVRICDSPSTSSLCSHEFVYNGEDVSVEFPVEGYFPVITLATAHFVHEGVPQTVTVTGWLYQVGSSVCSSAFGSALSIRRAVIREVAHIWPISSACSPVGADVDVLFNTVELGDIVGTFKWNGGSVDFDVDTGAFLQTPTPVPTPTSAPTATPTPAELPQTGGPPSSRERAHTIEVTAVGFVFAMASAIYVRRAVARRRRS